MLGSDPYDPRGGGPALVTLEEILRAWPPELPYRDMSLER